MTAPVRAAAAGRHLLRGAEAAEYSEAYLWGESGRSLGHPCDLRFGRNVTGILAAAQRQIDART
jgi:hypothetical protein